MLPAVRITALMCTNAFAVDVELCSLQHAHFLYRANIDNRRFPSNRFDKATHVRTEQMRSVNGDQNTQKQRVASDALRFHISVDSGLIHFVQ